MQHHGAPTRLLDWTESPYVAAYFAAEQCPDKDGAVYVVHAGLVNMEHQTGPGTDSSTFEAQLKDRKSPNQVLFYYPDYQTDRMIAQRGHFSVNLHVLGGHDDSLLRTLATISQREGMGYVCGKWLIPSSQKADFVRQLRVMNVAPHAMFPGLDGLGRSVDGLIRLLVLA